MCGHDCVGGMWWLGVLTVCLHVNVQVGWRDGRRGRDRRSASSVIRSEYGQCEKVDSVL